MSKARNWPLILLLILAVLATPRGARAQEAASRKWEILDNSFLVEESFNQEAGVFQNIVSWTRGNAGGWEATFTQEWPAPGIRHQLSYTIPFSHGDTSTGLGDALVNYRYQLREETRRGPALSPRLSLVIPTGNSDEGRGDDGYGLQVNFPASKQFGNFYVHLNGGFTWVPDAERTPIAAAGTAWRVSPMFNLMLEAVAEFDQSMTISPGFRRGWNVGSQQIVIGVAVPFTRENGATTAALLTYFSYELPFR